MNVIEQYFKDKMNGMIFEELGSSSDTIEPAQEEPEVIEEPKEESEPVINNTEKQFSRLLGIDRIKINKELKALCELPVRALPITSTKALLQRFGIKIVDDQGNDVDIKLNGDDGNTDFPLATLDNKSIKNSVITIYWHKNETEDNYNANIYLG